MQRIGLLVAAALALLLAILAGLVLTYQAALRTPPMEYTQARYTAERAILRVGQTLVYTPTLIVRQEGRVTVLRTFWDRTRSKSAALCDGSAAPSISIATNLPIGTIGNVRGANSVRVQTPNLPDGEYTLISSAVGTDGGQSVYEVWFSVAGGGC